MILLGKKNRPAPVQSWPIVSQILIFKNILMTLNKSRQVWIIIKCLVLNAHSSGRNINLDAKRGQHNNTR